MNQHEEELQKKVETGDVPEGIDAEAYRYVFSGLKREMDFSVSPTFSEKIMAKVEAKQKRETSRDFIWFGVGAFSILIGFVVAVVKSGFRIDFGFLNSISNYAGVFAFGAAFIILLHWLDKRILRNRNTPDVSH